MVLKQSFYEVPGMAITYTVVRHVFCHILDHNQLPSCRGVYCSITDSDTYNVTDRVSYGSAANTVSATDSSVISSRPIAMLR